MAVDAADRLDHGAAARRPNDRVARRDHERVAGDPEAELLLGREGDLGRQAWAWAAGSARGRAWPPVPASPSSGTTMATSISSSPLAPDGVLDEPARGRSRRSAWLTPARPPVSASETSRFVPGWPLNAALCIPGAMSRAPKSEREHRDDERVAGRREPSAVPSGEGRRRVARSRRRPAPTRVATAAPARPDRAAAAATGACAPCSAPRRRQAPAGSARADPRRRPRPTRGSAAASAARAGRCGIRSGSR